MRLTGCSLWCATTASRCFGRGAAHHGRRRRVAEFNPFGRRIDGREQYMRDLLWARLVDARRESPIALQGEALEAFLVESWSVFEHKVKARGSSLEQDGRGIEEMRRKLKYALRKWDTRIAVEARQPRKPGAWDDTPRSARASEPEPEAGPSKLASIATVDFYTLLTEVVIEEPDYIEPDFAGPGNFILLAGPPKAQKSFLLQEMLVACATGSKFLAGVFRVPKPLRVFSLQAEMNRKLLRKRAREFKFLTSEQKQLLKENFISSERFHMLLNEDGVKVAIKTIKAAFPDLPPDVIAIDPLANMFDGENESDNAQMLRFLMSRIEVIRQKINPLAMIAMVHHSRKAGAEDMARDPFVAIRGAGSLRSYYDSAIVIFKKAEEGKTRRVHFELRGGDSPEPVEVELVNGRFEKATTASGWPSKDVCRVIIGRIAEAWRRERPWSPYPQAKNENRYAVRNIVALFDVTATVAEDMLQQWQQNGVITFRERAPRKHPAGFEVTGTIDGQVE